jgi:sugar phosphate isomerase/epimerase
MKYNRRSFLQLTGAVGAGYALTGLSGHSLFSADDEAKKKIKTFGLQLYTLRDVLLNAPKDILKQLASFGYKQIESYEGPKGMFWGMSNTDFKKVMDDLGMTIVSSHCDINKDFEKKANDAAAIGMKYLLCPSVDAQKTIDGYKKLAAQFNQCGEICKKAGIKFAYHNHDHDFKILDGQVAQDIFMQHTDASLVDFEMDIYWVVTAKHDPEVWLKKYPTRFRLCHIKDRIKGATERDASCNLGTGSIDFSKILKTAKENGMQYYIAEQERYDGTTPLKAVEADAQYMKKLRF